MPQLAADPAPTFAGLLASLTLPKKPIIPLDELEPDVATLTYESALRTHARYRTDPIPDLDCPPPKPIEKMPAADAALKPESPSPAGALTSLEQSRKRSSITIRLTHSECAQLHQRAAEAGLTVSAYLRSCTVEVESLRAQVKQALADLRSPRSTKPRRFSTLLRRLHFLPRPAQA